MFMENEGDIEAMCFIAADINQLFIVSAIKTERTAHSHRELPVRLLSFAIAVDVVFI